jgi:hypothetical protein
MLAPINGNRTPSNIRPAFHARMGGCSSFAAWCAKRTCRAAYPPHHATRHCHRRKTQRNQRA